jgi:hypothetical protein
MANRTMVYKPSNWNLYIFQPESGSFVLNFSQLDGIDVLGTNSGFMSPIFGFTQITLSEGGEVSQGLFPQLSLPTLNVTLQIKNFEIGRIRDFYIGKEIRLSLTHPPGYNDSVYGDQTPIFFGIIDGFDVQLIPGENYSSVTLSASSKLQSMLNSLLAITKATTPDRGTIMQTSSSAAGFNQTGKIFSASSRYNFANTVTETKPIGEWLNELVLSDFLVPYVQNDPIAFISNGFNFDIDYDDQLIFSFGNRTAPELLSFGSNEIIECDLNWSGLDAPNSLKLINYANDTIVYNYSKPIDDSNQVVTYESTLDVKDLTQLTEIGNKMAGFEMSYEPVSITVLNAVPYQNLSFRNDVYSGWDYWNYPERLANVGNLIEIDLPQFGIDNRQMIVTGRTLQITSDNWTTTYNLWKGFTN